MLLPGLLLLTAGATLCLAQGYDTIEDGETIPLAGVNATIDELELFGEAAEYLIELHEFFIEYERLKAQSKAEKILSDAFNEVFVSAAVIVDQAKVTGRHDIVACASDVQEAADQTLNDLQSLLTECYNLEVADKDDEDGDPTADRERVEEDTLRQEVADFLQVAVGLLELVSEDTAAVLKSNKQLSQALSQHAIMLARNFQKTRVVVRNCVDLQLEGAYQQADHATAEASACLMLGHHEEL